MKKLTTKTFAFIIAIMIFYIVTNPVNAQKPKGNGHHGGGHGGGTTCNCNVRPIPFECGQICGFVINKPTENNVFSVYGNNLIAISFELIEAQNVSLKIYDGTGRLVKTFANNRMAEGEHKIEWNTKDENGNLVTAGNYILQFTTGGIAGTKKFSVIR